MTKKANKATLDNCGPIPFLQINQTGTVDPDNKRSAMPEPVPEPEPEPAAEAEGNLLDKRYLVNFTVGEDYAVCHSCPQSSCSTIKKYPWDTSVWLQCYEMTTSTNPNETYWLYTTDFCWVREVDFWESLFDRESSSGEDRDKKMILTTSRIQVPRMQLVQLRNWIGEKCAKLIGVRSSHFLSYFTAESHK
jgi:hypothetical protein